MAKTATSVAEPRQPQEEGGDSPLIDTMGAAVKKVVAQGKERGYITYDQLNAILPPWLPQRSGPDFELHPSRRFRSAPLRRV